MVATEFSRKLKIRVLCLPDIDKAIGGVKQLYRHVERLVALGWDAAMVTEAEGFRPSWFSSSAPTAPAKECEERRTGGPNHCFGITRNVSGRRSWIFSRFRSISPCSSCVQPERLLLLWRVCLWYLRRPSAFLRSPISSPGPQRFRRYAPWRATLA